MPSLVAEMRRLQEMAARPGEGQDLRLAIAELILALTEAADGIRSAGARPEAQNDEHYRRIIDNVNDIIYTHDLRGNFTWLNKAAERITGYSNEEALQLNIADVVAPEYLSLARHALARRLAGDAFLTFELEIIAKDGRRIPLEYNTGLIFHDGEPVGVQGAARDITGRKRAEKVQAATYRISESANAAENLDELFRSIHEIVGELMPAGNLYIALYDEAAEIISFPYFVDAHEDPPKPRRLGKGLTEYVLRTGAPLQATPEVLADLSRRGEAELIGARSHDWLGVPLKTKDKTIGALVVQSYGARVAFGEEEKNILAFVSTQVAMAIERKRSEHALRESEERFRAISEASPLGIFVTDQNGECVYVNQVYQRISGSPLKDALGKGWIAALHPDDREMAFAEWSLLAGRPRAYERVLRLIHKDGSIVWISVKAAPIGEGQGVKGFVGTVEDVTDRKRQEEERERLLAREQAARKEAEHVGLLYTKLFDREQAARAEAEAARREWQSTFDAMTDVVMLIDKEDRLIRANRAFYEQRGPDSTPENSVGRPIREIMHGSSSGLAARACPICILRLRRERAAIELAPGAAADYPLLLSIDPVINTDGEVIGVIQIARDQSDLHRARKDAERDRTSLEATIEQMAEGLVVFDERPAVIRANRHAQRIFGFTRDETLSADLAALLRGRFTDEKGQRLGMRSLTPAIALREQRVVNQRLWYERPDGQRLLVAITASPFFDDENKPVGVIAVVRDITEQEREYERAQQADKLRALGQLASGVAHNFNNALAAVIGYTQLALPKVKDPDVEKYLRVVEQSAKDAARMVERIQNFSRGSNYNDDLIQLKLADILRDAVEITRPRWQADAQALGLKYEVAIDLGAAEELLIKAEPSELREVFVNIILNALDAMPLGGSLTVGQTAAGPGVRITFTDTGGGMTEEIKRRIFEPFFTTKGVSGLGMGLSESYRIIERHGGRIDVESSLHRGSTFSITLPVLQVAERPPAARHNRGHAFRARVLVIDDEESVRGVLAEILEHHGHEVACAAGADEAVKLVEANHFDIVITDLAMPKTDGLAAAAAIKALKPGVKIVLMSGYGAERAYQRNAQNPCIDAAISKPFRVGEIQETLRELLTK